MGPNALQGASEVKPEHAPQVALLLAEVSAGGRSGLHDVVAAPLQRLPGMLQTRWATATATARVCLCACI